MASTVNDRKVAIIGCGFVGSACAFSLLQSGLFSEMVMMDVDEERAEGEALDISNGMAFASPMNIYAGGYDDAVDAAIVIITAGANQKPGESRIDLVTRNVKIFDSILAEIRERKYAGIILVVSNPVDILTYVTIKLAGIPEHRIIGSGTVLDTARLKQMIGEELGVDPRNVHARILGEHGDSEIIAWSSAHVAGIPLEDFFHMRKDGSYEEFRDNMSDSVRNAAYEIIKKKHATYYGIALSVKRICEAIVRDEKSVLSVSNELHGEYGIKSVALSTPCIVGKTGIEGKLPPALNYEEQKQLNHSADLLKGILKEVSLPGHKHPEKEQA
ncbi:MAG: L-lactate dehydrogenase [Eggerthellaceae bacterium]|nr:L-lactate dehydrogenase [Eggerthellaceae bacterium]